MRGADKTVQAIWIDDPENCELHHARDTNFFHHLYEGKVETTGNAYPMALRCPRSLQEDEKDRVYTDSPKGKWREVIKMIEMGS